MKIFLFFFGFLGLCSFNIYCLTPEIVAQVKQFQNSCIKETGVNPDLITKSRNGEFAEDEKLKNYMFCVSKKHGFATEDGKILKDVLIAKMGVIMDDQELSKLLCERCAKKRNTPQETAFRTVKCYYEKTHFIPIM